MADALRRGLRFADVPGWSRWQRAGLAVFAGLFLAAGQMGLPNGWLWVVVGLVIAFRGAVRLPVRQAALFGWELGATFFAITVRWIVEPFFVDPVRHGWMAPFAITFMAGGLALFWSAAFGLAARIGTGGARILAFAALLIGAEVVRSHVLTGLPWALPGYSLIGTPFDYLLAFDGPHGAGLVLAAVAALGAWSLERGWTLVWPGFAAILFAFIGLAFAVPEAPEAGEGPVVRLVQPNAPQHLKWTAEWAPVFFQRALDLTAEGEVPEIVLWPETSVPALLNRAEPWLEEIAGASRGATVVAGIQRFNPEAGYHNSVAVVEPDATVSDVYDKRHLVPFGEYIPLGHLIAGLGIEALADRVGGFAPGAGGGTFDLPGLGRARLLICYEGIFPEEIIEEGPRPDVLVILTNDAWFGTGAGPRQHLAQARARAIEQGLPVVRVANTGISAFIDARGEVLTSLPLNSEGALDGVVPPALPPTLYSRVGDWPVLVLLILAIAGAAVLGRRNAVDGVRQAG